MHTTFTVGRLTCHALEAGRQHLDGGAMFGVVPKPLWERHLAADARNRIPLALRCLLIEHDAGLVLVDTGAGNKESARFVELYGLENAGRDGRTALEDVLADLGFQPADVAWVIDTHLHFDHAGGNTERGEDGCARPAFPNARYIIRRGEWEFARLENERVRASYLEDNFIPLETAGCVDFVEADGEVAPGVHVVCTPGHTPHHQSVLIEMGGLRLLYLADLVPTRAHVPLPWIMGYDVEPLVTLESKRQMLTRAAEEGWLLGFEHDPSVAWGRAVPLEEGSGCALVDEVAHPLAGRASDTFSTSTSS